jgi:hypothetical protein
MDLLRYIPALSKMFIGKIGALKRSARAIASEVLASIISSILSLRKLYWNKTQNQLTCE